MPRLKMTGCSTRGVRDKSMEKKDSIAPTRIYRNIQPFPPRSPISVLLRALPPAPVHTVLLATEHSGD